MICTRLLKRAKHKTYSAIDDNWVILTTSKAFYYFQVWRNENRFAFAHPQYVNKITVEDRVSDSFRYIFLKWYCTNTVWREPRNITTQPGDINYRKSKVIAFVVTLVWILLPITLAFKYMNKKDVSFFVGSICFIKLKFSWIYIGSMFSKCRIISGEDIERYSPFMSYRTRFSQIFLSYYWTRYIEKYLR